MIKAVFIVALNLLIASAVLGKLDAPEDLIASIEHDGAIITFASVADAAGYLGVLDDGTSVENASPQLYFGGLLPLTEYTAIVSTLDIDGEPGSPSIITFETGVGAVTNLKVVTVSPSLISLEWDPMPGVQRYIVEPEEDTTVQPVVFSSTDDTEAPFLPPQVTMSGEASAVLSNLKQMTYYTIRIRGMKDQDLGPVASIRTRTDGKGLVIYNIWSNHLNAMLGGSGMIFKGLDRPKGPYSIKVTFPCPLQKFEVWDAVIQNSSLPEEGIYDLFQEDVWMQEKNEVGFNFYTTYNETSFDNCILEMSDIQVEYGSDALPSEFTEEFDVPFDVADWNGGGILYVRLDKIFRGPNRGVDEEEAKIRAVKPDRSKMVIQIQHGSNCSDVNLMVCWNVDRIYNVTTDVAEEAYYFVQTGDNWYTNDIGLMFEYTPSLCEDPNDWNVNMLVGGNLVSSLHESYEIQDFYGTCHEV